MSKFKKKTKVPKASADTSDFTGVRVTQELSAEGVLVLQFLLPNGDDFDVHPDDDDATALLAIQGTIMGKALSSNPDYESA